MVADELVEGEIDDPDFQQRMMAAMNRVTERLKATEDLKREGEEGDSASA
jgi:hypothetical protein